MRATIPAAFMLALSGSTAAAQVYPPPSSPPSSSAPQQGAPKQGVPIQFGLRCKTPQSSCNLPQPGRVGNGCFCNSPAGRLNGTVTQ
jgi:hypothetical protein